MANTRHVLRVSASGRRDGSVTRALGNELIQALIAANGRIEIIERDLAQGIPLVDEQWIDANFTAPEARDAAQRAALETSDALVDELRQADAIIIELPIYNFSLPASLKAWIDMIARARLTFRYTDKGPQGLLHGKKVYIAAASGGVQVGSAVDFATPYLRHALKFVGIGDVQIIAADEQNRLGEAAFIAAKRQIDTLNMRLPATNAAAA